MKKKLLALVFVILTVSLVALSGCGNDATLYSLREVYEAGEITRDDLLNMAYYSHDEKWNEEAMRDFTPQPIEELSEETSLKIREALAKDYLQQDSKSELTAKDFKIVEYLGNYNGYHAFQHCVLGDFYLNEELYERVIDGVVYKYRDSEGFIMLWKEN